MGTFSASRDAGDDITMLPKFKQGRGPLPGQIVTVGSPPLFTQPNYLDRSKYYVCYLISLTELQRYNLFGLYLKQNRDVNSVTPLYVPFTIRVIALQCTGTLIHFIIEMSGKSSQRPGRCKIDLDRPQQ